MRRRIVTMIMMIEAEHWRLIIFIIIIGFYIYDAVVDMMFVKPIFSGIIIIIIIIFIIIMIYRHKLLFDHIVERRDNTVDGNG